MKKNKKAGDVTKEGKEQAERRKTTSTEGPELFSEKARDTLKRRRGPKTGSKG